MATVNKRVGLPQANVINGVDAGGMMSAAIQEGYENIIRSPSDGSTVPSIDKEVQFVRGSVVSQDWIEFVNLLIGALGTKVFYERKSGVVESTGYIKHTLTNPVIHRAALAFTKAGFASVAYDFECRFADETKTIADVHAMTDSQNAPTYVSSARGGYRIISTVYGGSLNIYHVTGFNFALTLPLVKDCNDADIGYTCVDARLDGMTAVGGINFQDAGIASAKLTCQQLLLAALGNLVIRVKQFQGATDKLITIARANILNAGENSDVNTPFTGFNANFEVTNNPAAPLSLAGTNKIITIEDAT